MPAGFCTPIVPGVGMGRGVDALSLQRQCSDINMRSSNWRDGEIRELLTIMGEKVMQSRLTKTLKDGAILRQSSRRTTLRGFCQDNKHVAVFALVNSESRL